MRRTVVATAALAALVAAGGVASADVTDVVVTAALPGALTITGTGALPAAPLGASSSATIGGSASVAGSALTVADLRGVTSGWQVNAKYLPLAGGVLSSLTLPTGVLTAENIGGANVTVSGSTAGVAATNALLGVADAGLSFSNGDLSAAGGRTLLSTTGDGRGTTLLSTSYSLNLPAKTSTAATLYTGSVLYTVGPKAAS